MFNLVPSRRNSEDMFLFDPFKEMNNIFDGFINPKDIEHFKSMKTDIKEYEDSYVLEIEIPGFKKEDISLKINDNVLLISAKREVKHEEKDKDGNFIHCERSYGTFSRSFNVDNVKVNEINAEYSDGILTVKLPKKEEKKKDTIKIDVK